MFLFTNWEPRLFEMVSLRGLNPAVNWRIVVKFSRANAFILWKVWTFSWWNEFVWVITVEFYCLRIIKLQVI